MRSSPNPEEPGPRPPRFSQDFQHRGGAGVLAAACASAAAPTPPGSDMLKIGLIGCGGRGTGAAGNAMTADKNAKLVAMADAFADRLEVSLTAPQEAVRRPRGRAPGALLRRLRRLREADPSGVDVVMLAEPPHFRPQHLKAAIDAGKHVFCEKPVAVDAPGVRCVLATSEEAAKKNLSLVSGLCWRYHNGVRETMQRVSTAPSATFVAIQETYLTGTLGGRGASPKWTEMEYQLRNWYYFTWLSGDHNVEQHVHSLDKAALGDARRAAGAGLGHRRAPGPHRPELRRHLRPSRRRATSIADGTQVYAYCRQQAGCWGDVSDVFLGTKGRAPS